MSVKSIAFLYYNACTDAADLAMVGDCLANDEAVMGASAVAQCKAAWLKGDAEAMLKKSYMYIDIWGASKYFNSEHGNPRWYPAPGDLGHPNVKSDSSPFMYRWDRHHRWQFIRWVWKMVQAEKCKGVFLDDWDDDSEKRRRWKLSTAQMQKCWPLAYDDTGLYEHRWSHKEMQWVEYGLMCFMALRRKKILANVGKSTVAKNVPVLLEGYGRWLNQADLMGWIKRHPKGGAGVRVLVKGIRGDRETWAQTDFETGGYEPGTSYRDVFRDLLEIADKHGVTVGLSLFDKPEGGGSTCGVHRFINPKTWGRI
jgi:hypothetical protein